MYNYKEMERFPKFIMQGYYNLCMLVWGYEGLEGGKGWWCGGC